MARILIVDDEYLVAACLGDVLEEDGYEVCIAGSGMAALAMVRDCPPDLVVTDFMMPGMTGLELAAALRDDPAMCAIPVVLVSGAQGCLARGRMDLFVAVLDKPYPVERLLAVIGRLLAGSRN